MRFNRRLTRALIFVGLGSLVLCACSLLFPTSQNQCANDDECRMKGPAFSNTKCTANLCVALQVEGGVEAGTDASSDPFYCPPPTSVDESDLVDLTLRFIDSTRSTVLGGLEVRLCAAADQQCFKPNDAVSGSGPGDAGGDGGMGWVVPREGRVTAKVGRGFAGFFETRSLRYPLSVRYFAPLQKKTNEFEQVLLEAGEIQYLANRATGEAGVYDPANYALVFIRPTDCNYRPLPSVQVDATVRGPKQFVFYVIGDTPSIVDKATDFTGLAGIANVPEGTHTFTSEWADGGKHIGSGRANIRIGSNTTVSILPTP